MGLIKGHTRSLDYTSHGIARSPKSGALQQGPEDNSEGLEFRGLGFRVQGLGFRV